MDAKKHRTFGDLTTDYYRQLASCFAKAQTVADELAFCQHVKPGGSYGCLPLLECCTSQDNQRLPGLKQLSQFIEGRNIPDWKKFLSVKENKQALVNFFGDFIVKFTLYHLHGTWTSG
jgi:hypothetical protein